MLTGYPVLAQNVVFDGSLGSATSLEGPDYEILQELGTTVGENLFHSFESFSLEQGESAYFYSDSQVRNILSRVTGRNPSSIDGLLLTTSVDVNLFLVNPNGISFGPNARLDIGGSSRGSFVATTVDGFVWPSGSRFDAVTPGDTQGLLNIVGDPSGFIASQRVIPAIELVGSNLSLYNGQSLLLLGGDVWMTGSSLLAGDGGGAGGRIEAAGLAEAGVVPLLVQGNDLSLQFPANLARSNLDILDTVIDVQSVGGGYLSLYGDDVSIDISPFFAGISSRADDDSVVQAGDVIIDATGRLDLERSFIANTVNSDGFSKAGEVQISAAELIARNTEILSGAVGAGDSGKVSIDASERILLESSNVFTQVSAGQGENVVIMTPLLEVLNSGEISTLTLGEGDSGSVMIDASDKVVLTDSSVSSSVAAGATGSGGDVDIRTPVLEMLGGELKTVTAGDGDAGDLKIDVSERIFLSDWTDFNNSTVLSVVEEGAKGQGGDVMIRTPILEAVDGGLISAETAGDGDSGNVFIDASERIALNQSQVTSFVVDDEHLFRDDEATTGQGGNLIIQTPVLEVFEGAISTGTFGAGEPGTINLDVSETIVLNDSSIFSRPSFRVQGKGGDIIIQTSALEAFNRTSIGTSTDGDSEAGDVIIDASQRIVLNDSSVGSYVADAYLFGDTFFEGIPPDLGGDLTIRSSVIELFNSASIGTSTLGEANAGDVTIEVSDRLLLDGTDPENPLRASQITTTNGIPFEQFLRFEGEEFFYPLLVDPTAGAGFVGTINVTAPQISIRNGARIDSRTFNAAPGGDIKLKVLGQLSLDRGSIIASSDGEGNGGNIEIESQQAILLDNGSIIATNSGGSRNDDGAIELLPDVLIDGVLAYFSDQGVGDGGNIDIQTPFLIGFPGENNDIITNAIGGNGGQINIAANSILNFKIQDGQRRRQLRSNLVNDISASSATGTSGLITLDTPDVEPANNLAELPVDFVDGSRLIAQNLCRDGAGSEFIVTGRGGLPLAPQDVFQPDLEWEDWRISSDQLALTEDVFEPRLFENLEKRQISSQEDGRGQESELLYSHDASPLEEAQGWTRSPSGQIQLTAARPAVEPSSPNPVLNRQPLSCQQHSALSQAS